MNRYAGTLDTGRAFLALARTTLLFRLGGQRKVAAATARVALRSAPATPLSKERALAVWRAQRAVIRAKRFWPASVRCLQTALTLQRVLHQRGIDASLCLGVRHASQQLEAHAWLEVGGLVLDDAGLAADFAVLQRDSFRQEDGGAWQA